MPHLTKILRFRFDEETAAILKKLPRKSDFVRQAVRELLEKKKLSEKEKLPF